MLMVVESAVVSNLFFAPAPRAVVAERVVVTVRFGDTFRYGPERNAVEVLLGFRPGVDQVVIVAGENAPRGGRILTTEEAGTAVIRDAAGRRIVLQGVALSDLKAGDIEIERA